MFVLKKNINDKSIKKFSNEHDLRYLKHLKEMKKILEKLQLKILI